MPRNNVLRVTVGNTANEYTTSPLYQYDTGIVLKIAGIQLPTGYQVQFSNEPYGTSTTSIGTENGVSIPSTYLESGSDVYAWLYLHTGENDSETVLMIRIPVIPRAAITDEEPTAEEQSEIDELIIALNAAVDAAEDAQDAAEAAQQAAEDAQDAIENLGVSASTLAAGSSATVTKSVDSGTGAVSFAFGIPKGDKGDQGDPGNYTKPEGGIPSSDMTSAVQTSLGKADTAYQKPTGGIPSTDLASGVLTSIIDDTAGDGDTGKTWSADKIHETTSSKLDKPTTAGTSGQVLTANGSGGQAWANNPSDAQVETAVNAWLEENITNPDSPPLDRSLSSSSSAAPADIVGDIKSAKTSSDCEGYGTFFGLSNFQPAGLNTDGSLKTSQQYRLSCSTHLKYNRNITIMVKSGFKWGYIPFTSGTAGSWKGWYTTPITIEANTEFVVQIARTTENTSETSTVHEFLGSLYFDSSITANKKEFDNVVMENAEYDNWYDPKDAYKAYDANASSSRDSYVTHNNDGSFTVTASNNSTGQVIIISTNAGKKLKAGKYTLSARITLNENLTDSTTAREAVIRVGRAYSTQQTVSLTTERGGDTEISTSAKVGWVKGTFDVSAEEVFSFETIIKSSALGSGTYPYVVDNIQIIAGSEVGTYRENTYNLKDGVARKDIKKLQDALDGSRYIDLEVGSMNSGKPTSSSAYMRSKYFTKANAGDTLTVAPKASGLYYGVIYLYTTDDDSGFTNGVSIPTTSANNTWTYVFSSDCYFKIRASNASSGASITQSDLYLYSDTFHISHTYNSNELLGTVGRLGIDYSTLNSAINGKFTLAIQTDTHISAYDGYSTSLYPKSDFNKLESVVHGINKLNVHLFAHLGDFIRGYQFDPDFESRRTIEMMMDRYSDVATNKAFVIGNHDDGCLYYNNTDYNDCKTITNVMFPTEQFNRYTKYGLNNKGKSNYYYADVGGVRIITLYQRDFDYSSAVPGIEAFRISPNQITWLSGTALNTELPVIILTHAPLLSSLYATSREGFDEALNVIETFASTHTVIAVLSGHTHEQNASKVNGVNHIVFKNGYDFFELVSVDLTENTITCKVVNNSNLSDRSFTY